MQSIKEILENSGGKIKIEVSAEDLEAFSNNLIEKAKQELFQKQEQKEEYRYLTREEAKELCGVCYTTLWHWNKRGYLKTIKLGSKVLYKHSDIQKLLANEK